MRRVLVLLLLALPGCAATKARTTYLRVHDHHTEELRIYRGFGTALIFRPTLLTADMAAALAAERGRVMGGATDDGDAFLARLADEGEVYWDVVFSAESDLEYDYPRFGEDDRGWRLRLLADDAEQQLVTVYRVKSPTLLQQALYAQKNAWNDLYVARFEKSAPAPSRLVLHVGSGFGHGAVTWTGDELR